MRLEYEGLSKSDAVMAKGARFYNDPAGFALERYAYYVCFKCGKAYFGGEAQCDADAGQGDDFNPEELVCGACSDVSRYVKNNKNSNKTVEMKNVSMYSGCLGSVSYICLLISFYSTISGLKCVPNMVRIT